MSQARADSDSRIETPEGIELVMPLADPVARGYAFAIDFAIRYFLFWISILTLTFLGNFGFGILLIFFFIIMWGYFILFEMWWDGASPGKRIMKIRVVHDDFTPINFSSSIVRNLLRTADMMPGCYGLAIMTMLFNKDNKRLGDIAAQTIVVSTQRPRYRSISVTEKALAPDVLLNQAEQRRVIEFARFYEVNSNDRSNEIAFLLREALDEPDITKLTTKLRRYAKWFLGERN